MIRSLRHFGLVVRDLEACLAFYRDTLGLRVIREMVESGNFLDAILGASLVRVTTVKLAAGEGPTLIELLRFESPQVEDTGVPSLFQSGATHFAVTVDSMHQVLNVLHRVGADTISEPQHSPDGRALVCFVRDPEGNLIELVEELKS